MGISQEPGQVIETDPAFSGKSNRHNCFFPGNVDALDGGGCVTVDHSLVSVWPECCDSHGLPAWGLHRLSLWRPGWKHMMRRCWFDALPAFQRPRVGLSPGLYSCWVFFLFTSSLSFNMSPLYSIFTLRQKIFSLFYFPPVIKTFPILDVPRGRNWCWVWAGQDCELKLTLPILYVDGESNYWV